MSNQSTQAYLRIVLILVLVAGVFGRYLASVAHQQATRLSLEQLHSAPPTNVEPRGSLIQKSGDSIVAPALTPATITGWQRYVSPELGLSFEYPIDYGSVTLEDNRAGQSIDVGRGELLQVTFSHRPSLSASATSTDFVWAFPGEKPHFQFINCGSWSGTYTSSAKVPGVTCQTVFNQAGRTSYISYEADTDLFGPSDGGYVRLLKNARLPVLKFEDTEPATTTREVLKRIVTSVRYLE